MDAVVDYGSIIKSVLSRYAEERVAFADGYDCRVLFDDERGQFLILDVGWSGNEYLHSTPIHLSLRDGKIWVECDDTEEGVASDLMEAGVRKEDIVLGFRHPKVRVHTGFAVM
jgi:XisI protein